MVDRKTSDANKNRIRLVFENWQIADDGTITFKDIGDKGYVNARWEFDDSPLVQGTPMVKDTFLSDATMSKFGYASSSYDATTLDDVLGDHVAYSVSAVRDQTSMLTTEQKKTARDNINAVGTDDFGVTVASIDTSTNKVQASQTSAAYEEITSNKTVNLSMCGKMIGTNSASAITITIPLASASYIPVGSEIEFVRIGEGSVTFAGAEGVTLLSLDSLKSIGNVNGVVMIKYLTGDKVLLVGDLI